MPVHERLLRTDPAYLSARSISETRAWQYAAMRGAVGRPGVTSIPVVVHVVHRTQAQNVSDAQIRSQIQVLNRDFRMTNPDLSSTPPIFQPLTADARIQFELATKDPQGNPSNGITRTQTNAASFGDDDAVKSAATGGADAWPSDQYLNIWVCELSGGLLGYAQFPGGSATTDGVVITHTAFGTTGTAAAPFNLGRTATHEIGHWLNLRHIWGDDGTGCNGSDFVADTPNQAGPNYGTPNFPVITCNNAPNGDLFMNYMDYVDDAAMFMFTHGQVTRMQACLDSDRATLGTAVAGPKIKIADDPVSLKFRDDPQTGKFTDDPGTLKFRDDPQTVKLVDDPGSLKFRDDPQTGKFTDDPGTLKFRDDPQTVKLVDDPGSLKFRDDPQTGKFTDDPGSLKFRDDGSPTIKFIDDGPGTNPTLDPIKQPGLDKPPGVDQPWPGPGGGMPFILATPHHSMAWARSFPGAHRAALASHEAQLAEYEQLLAQYAQADAEGQLGAADRAEAEALYAEYGRLAEEYRQLSGC
jgi:hypothetical protein